MTKDDPKFFKLEQKKLEFECECHARDQWWQEDRLVNQRLTWLLTSHGVIGAGYAWLKHRVAEINIDLAKTCPGRLFEAQKHYQEQLIELSSLLVVLGATVSVLIFVGIASAIRAQYILKKKHYPQYRLYVSDMTTRGGHAVALIIPLLCLGAWVWIL